MADASYHMSTPWTNTQSTPQLETAYDMDPTLFDLAQPDIGPSSQRYSQGRQDTTYPAFPSAFNFNHQSRNLSQSADQTPYYDQVATGGQQSQQSSQFAVQGQMYQSPPQTHASQAHNGLNTTAAYTSSSPGYAYNQLQQQQQHRQHQHHPSDSHVVPPPMHNYENVPNQHPSPAPPAVFVSPPAVQYNPSFTSPGTHPMDIQHPQAPFYPPEQPAPAKEAFTGQSPAAKRQRAADEGGGWTEGDGNEETEARNEMLKPRGACARCKQLKVKCEFKTDPDTCKRCLSGNHDCIIPGRKKRRPPPKREHLITQIREQANQIKDLMQKLEQANMSAAQSSTSRVPSPSPSSITTDLLSDASHPSDSYISSDVDLDSLGSSDLATKPDLQNWIAQAHQSLEQFGKYIDMGGPGATRDMLVQNDADGNGSVGSGDDYLAVTVDDMDEDNFSHTEIPPDHDQDDHYLSDHEEIDRKPHGHVRRLSGTDRLATIPSEAAPFGLMAKLSLEVKPKRAHSRTPSEVAEDSEKQKVGLENEDYFRPSPAIERPIVNEKQQMPHILREGVVNLSEVEKLFTIYWDYMNLSVSLLDPHLYTPQTTFWRSPFLFTTICAIAARYYTPRPDLYQQAMHYARLAAGTALIGGRKCVETVSAYILLALYPIPCQRWEDDRSWVYLGLAIRIASDLNLHHPTTAKPRDEQHARELLNRTRVWLNCFNLDRSTGSQYGKPPIIPNSDYTACHSADWWNSSEFSLKNFDIQLSAYNADLRVMANFALRIRGDAQNPTGLHKSLDIAKIASETDDELVETWDHWKALIKQHNDPEDEQGRFRTGLLVLAFSYARLTALSFGFQYAFGRKAPSTTKSDDERFMLWRCFRAAKDVLKAYLDEIAVPSQRKYLTHGPEAQSVFVTFASAFLIKLLHPRFAVYLTLEHRKEARGLVERLSDVLAEVAFDERHYPKLYSQFIKGLLSSPMANVDHPVVIKREVVDPPKKLVLKAKSASPSTQRAQLSVDLSPSRESVSTPSSTRHSASPPPSQPMDGVYQHYGLGPTTMDPYSHHEEAGPFLASDLSTEMNNNLTSFPPYFQPPLPFDPELDSDLLQFMHTLTDPSMCPEAMPGFGWMEGFRQNDAVMVNGDMSH